jgi:4-oxalocrotonate tautomerase
MPIVHIHLMQGRPPERIEAMIAEVSQAIAGSIGAPIDSVRVLVHEMTDHQYGVGGRPIREILAARAAQAKEA